MPLRDGRETPEEYAERHRRNEEKARAYRERQVAHAARQHAWEQEQAERKRAWEERQSQREREKEENYQKKWTLILAASLLADKQDWKDGRKEAEDLMEEWRAVRPYRGEDEDKALWNSFKCNLQRYFDGLKAHKEQRQRNTQAAAERRDSILDEARALCADFGYKQINPVERKLKELRRNYAEAGPFKYGDYHHCWERFNSIENAFRIQAEALKLEERGKFAGYVETGRYTNGKVATRVTVGSHGYTHNTQTAAGKGHTTGHASGRQHHHDTHTQTSKKDRFQQTEIKPSGRIIDDFLK